MSRSIASALTVAMFVIGASVPAAGQLAGTGGLQGVAAGADKTPLAHHTVQLRHAETGQIAGATASTAAGQFSFAGLNPGSYVVEVVNAAGSVIGTSAPVAVTAGAVVTGVTVTASIAGLAAAAAAGRAAAFFSSTAGVVIVSAAIVGATAAVIATREPASPSR